jgi:hypothetical protein
MSTITSTPSVPETLFTTFRHDNRKHDFRTARGKFFKHLSSKTDCKVTIGIADLVQENWNWDEDTETRTSSFSNVPYNVLYVSVNDTWQDIIALAESYLREVAPTRKVYGTDYKDEFIIPNVVRVAVSSVYVEDRADGGWGDRDRFEAYCVLSVAIDPETDKVFHIDEVVGQHHEWASNPFINEGDWRRDDDEIKTLKTVSALRDAVESKRESIASGQRTQQLITECVERGQAEHKYFIEQAHYKCQRFLDKFEESLTKEVSRPIEHAYDIAFNTSVKSLVDFYLNVLGKTSWEVSSSTFSIGRRSYFQQNEADDLPRFIDDALAFALTTDWFIGRDSWDTTPASARGEVLERFRNVLRGY